jgi:hypothetical protein
MPERHDDTARNYLTVTEDSPEEELEFLLAGDDPYAEVRAALLSTAEKEEVVAEVERGLLEEGRDAGEHL